ncbi:MAG TPA: hypothetical protein VFK05_33560 [Polyangiaceae bacterium]|nr:hypothetical protein [Polyangiaceae bacterium]
MSSAARVDRSWWLLLLLVGCSLVDPQVGSPQASCGNSAGGGQSNPGSPYYQRSPNQIGTVPTCESHADGSCNACESTHCCATRSACYGDPVCACADSSLDECLEEAETRATAEQQAATSRCWSDFAARGTVEQARLSCQRAWCQSECGIP